MDSQMPAHDPKSNQMVMAILAYLGILIVIPYIVAKDNPFVKFHIKQGLLVFIIYIILWLLSGIFGVNTFLLGLGSLFDLIYLGLLVLTIIGIINAVQGQEKELPLIGHLAAKFTF